MMIRIMITNLVTMPVTHPNSITPPRSPLLPCQISGRQMWPGEVLVLRLN